MCGIFVSNDFRINQRHSRTIENGLQFRGPDNSSGLIEHNGWKAYHSRLSIIEFSSDSNQPIINKIGGMLIFNGEILNFKELGIDNKMIVITDGDLMRNRYNESTQQFYALGFDRYTNRIYSNKEFFLNCFNYLLDDSGLIAARTKEFKIRELDIEKTKKSKSNWQAVNVGLPIVLVLIFGAIQFYLRKNKFGNS